MEDAPAELVPVEATVEPAVVAMSEPVDAAPAGAPSSRMAAFVPRKASGESTVLGDAGSADAPLWEGTSKTLTGVGGGRYKLTRRYLLFERGMLSSQSQQVPLEQIHDVDVKQSLAQRSRGVSDVIVHTNVTPARVELESITEASMVRDLINDAVRARHHEIQDRELRMRVPHVAVATGGGTGSAGAGDDLLAQLERLGSLRNAGVLTDDEFAAAKAKLLGS